MASPGHGDEVAEIFRELDGGLAPRAGLPEVHRASSRTSRAHFFIYEQYEDEAALDTTAIRRIF